MSKAESPTLRAGKSEKRNNRTRYMDCGRSAEGAAHRGKGGSDPIWQKIRPVSIIEFITLLIMRPISENHLVADPRKRMCQQRTVVPFDTGRILCHIRPYRRQTAPKIQGSRPVAIPVIGFTTLVFEKNRAPLSHQPPLDPGTALPKEPPLASKDYRKPENPRCRSTSYAPTATALERLRLRRPSRMGMRTSLPGWASSILSSMPRLSRPNTRNGSAP